jgi:hypothetical protein
MWVQIALLPCVHLSSIFILPLFYIASRKYSFKYYIFGLPLLFLVSRFILEFLLGSRYGFYLRTILYATEPYSLLMLIYPFAILLMSFRISMNRSLVNAHGVLAIIRLGIISSCLAVGLILLGINETLITRLNSYFYLLLVIIVPLFVEVQGKFNKIYKYAILIICLLLFIKVVFIDGRTYNLIPYRTLFELI